ncbi:MAG: dihydroorotase [bacterium JZ-2024 1]
MRMVLRRGTILYPPNRIRPERDVAIADGRIVRIGPRLKFDADLEIDCRSLMILPGLIDIHAHIREPGSPDKESFESAARAAANGGVTTLVMMPNTEPAIDTPERARYVRLRSQEVGGVDVLPAGALTIGRKGESPAPYALMMREGVRVFTDDGTHIQDAGLMKTVMQAVDGLGGIVMVHPEDRSLAKKGILHASEQTEKYGIPGISETSESVIVARDGLLSRELRARVHFTHISSRTSVDILRIFRRWRLPVTADVTFHHLLLDQFMMNLPEQVWKVNPPLRCPEDREVLRSAYRDGTLLCVCTDHAPHGQIPRGTPPDEQPFGFSSLDLAFSLLKSIFQSSEMPLGRRLATMTVCPARLLGLTDRAQLAPQKRADIIVVDPKKSFVVQEEHILSRGKNCPYLGMELQGVVLWTICGGRIVKEEGIVTVGCN